MEGKLIDILIISKKGVQFGENICTKAKIIVQEGKDEIDQLERTWAKLHFLAAKAAVQIRTVDSVAAHVKRVADGLGEYCQVTSLNLGAIFFASPYHPARDHPLYISQTTGNTRHILSPPANLYLTFRLTGPTQ